MTYLPYPNNPAALDATNPIFNDNSFVRGDEQRLNNSEIWDNFSALDTELISQDTRLDTIESTFLAKGYLNGGIEFDTSSTFPYVRRGVYEVSGKLIYKTAIYNILTSDTFFNNRQALESGVGYIIMMNSSGTIRYLIYGEGIAQASQSVTNSTGTTTKTLTVAAVPGSGSEEYIALISGTGSYTGAFKATRASATTFTITLSSDPGNTVTGMTVTLYYKIRTLHGTGTLANITNSTSANYSPSLGENTETNAFATFDSSKNGFYCTLSGLTDYRVIGSISGYQSSFQPYQVFSFLSGRNKNDNVINVDTVSALVCGSIRWTNLNTLFGCDYIFVTSNTSYGSWIEIQRTGIASARIQTFASAAVTLASVYVSIVANYVNNSLSNAELTTASVSAQTGSSSYTGKVSRGSLVKPLANSVTLSNANTRFDFTLQVQT